MKRAEHVCREADGDPNQLPKSTRYCAEIVRGPLIDLLPAFAVCLLQAMGPLRLGGLNLTDTWFRQCAFLRLAGLDLAGTQFGTHEFCSASCRELPPIPHACSKAKAATLAAVCKQQHACPCPGSQQPAPPLLNT